jgi:hypothetical protein
MPSIEIACIGLDTPAPIAAERFAVQYEPGLKSHRTPSRFAGDFNETTGCLYHLGHLRSATNGSRFFAYDLLSDASRTPFPPSFLEFSSEHVDEVRKVLERILTASPLGEVLFTSDWEYGPEWAYRFGPLTLEEFWRLHASRMLYLNAAYAIVAASHSAATAAE